MSRVLILLALIALICAALFPERHDYGNFGFQWTLVMEGQDPWRLDESYQNDRYPEVLRDSRERGGFTGNAYPPLYLVFAPFYSVFSKLPNLIFVVSWWIAAFLLFRIGARGLSFWLGIALNPYFWLSVVYYGQFDSVIALFVLLSYLLLERGKSLEAGFSIAAAGLLKIYPFAWVPTLGLNIKTLRGAIHFSVGLIVLVSVSYGLCFWIWGPSVFDPILFAQERPSKIFSIFRFLRASLIDLDDLSLPLTVIAYVASLICARYFQMKLLDSMILALYAILMFYKVGHAQFYMPLFFLVALKDVQDERVNWPVWAPLGLVSLAVTLYSMTRGLSGEWLWVREFIGLPMFVLQGGAMISLIVQTKESGINGSKHRKSD